MNLLAPTHLSAALCYPYSNSYPQIQTLKHICGFWRLYLQLMDWARVCTRVRIKLYYKYDFITFSTLPLLMDTGRCNHTHTHTSVAHSRYSQTRCCPSPRYSPHLSEVYVYFLLTFLKWNAVHPKRHIFLRIFSVSRRSLGKVQKY